MTLEEMRADVYATLKLANSIRSIMYHSPAQQGLAIKLFRDIEALREAIEMFRGGESINLAAEIGHRLQHIGISAAKLTIVPSEEVHARLNRIFMILNRMPKEGVRKEDPSLAGAFVKGLKTKT